MVRPRRRRAHQGFTLVELMVSLVMGLVVALAAVGLARTATNTFHEQARSSVTQMSVRSAADRLRQDLMRAAYMTTGNIKLDQKAAYLVEEDGSAAKRYESTSLKDLQGIRVVVGGSGGANTVFDAIAAKQGLSPDAIEITGNFTTDDAYTGTIMSASGCGSQLVRLDPQADAAVYSLLQSGSSLLGAASSAFRPNGGDFPVQVTDPMGCQHYAIACDVTVASGIVNVFLALEGATGRPVLYSHGEGSKGVASSCGASEGGPVTISPIARVRWQLRKSPAILAPTGTTEGEAESNVDLTRQLLDANGDAAGDPEVVAEYAVDLKFGLTVWNPTVVGDNKLQVLDFGNAAISNMPVASSTLSGQLGPQHVRSVRFRIATRTALPDRQVNIASPSGYLATFCVDNKTVATCKRFARVRTVVSEVTLHNQARMFY